jgi:hypothetical protein
VGEACSRSAPSSRATIAPVVTFSTNSRPACGRPPAALRPPSGPAAIRRSPGSRPHRPAQPAPTPHPDRHVVLTRFRACQRKGPGRCRLQRRDLAGVWFGGASVSGRQRRFERCLPRRLWRSRWARRFPMARSGSQRISKRHPASSHHKDRVHTLAPRPTRSIGFKGGTGNKKRPACARRSASVAPVGHTPTTTCRSVTIGQAIGQVSWSTAVRLPAGFVLIQSIRLPRITAVGRLARMGRAGPQSSGNRIATRCLSLAVTVNRG